MFQLIGNRQQLLPGISDDRQVALPRGYQHPLELTLVKALASPELVAEHVVNRDFAHISLDDHMRYRPVDGIQRAHLHMEDVAQRNQFVVHDLTAE